MSRRNRLRGFLRRRLMHLWVAGGVCLLVAASAVITYQAAVPGLPLTEDFSDTNLRDDTRTNANWSTDEQALLLAFRQTRFGGFSAGFASTSISADTDDSFGLALGDVDGDGDLDVVMANLGQPNRLYLNNGTTDPFNGVTGSDVTSDAQFSSAAALGDVDRDGDLDVVIANSGSQPNRLYLNNGTADPFSGVTGTNITDDAQVSVGIALGDMDGDGDLDVVVGNSSSQTNRLYLNNGTADPFNGVVGINITSDAASTRGIALGDMDGDGDLDLVAGNLSTTNRLYLNNGTADPFSGVAGTDISADANPTNGIALGDVDGDGDLDVVAANDLNVVNRVYLNNGTANPFNGVAGSDLTTSTNDSTGVALGDVDGDGDLDAMVTEFGQVDRIHLNNGSSTPFEDAVTIVTATAGPGEDVAFGDLDGDGDADIVTAELTQTNRLYLNNGGPNPFNGVVGSDITVGTESSISPALGDVDGDGDLDLVIGNDGQINQFFANNGTDDPWSGVAPLDITPDVNDTRSVALGDMDGDGDLDVVAGNEAGQINRLYLNSGTVDPFSGLTGADITTDANNTISVAVGDVDGDGDLDVVAGNTGQANRLYLNNGTADPFNGITGTNISGDTDSTRSVALGDVDGDGDLDVVAGNLGQTNRLYLNNGTADPFNGVTGTDISSDAGDTTGIALGDMDGDGDLDVVVSSLGQVSRLYLNNGTAAPFNGVTGVSITADTFDTLGLALGDVNRDGRLDLVTAELLQANRIYLNNRTSDPFNGVAGHDVTSDANLSTGVALGDVDGDGQPDLVVANSGEPNRSYLSAAPGAPWGGPVGEDLTSDTDATRAEALGDVDGDGDLDLVVGNTGGPNRLYLNNGTSDPWSGVSGSDITSDADDTTSVALGDVDGDGDLDLVAGNDNLQTNRVYLNNGTADPWGGVSGSDITTDAHDTAGVALGDVDGDGDLDLVAANRGVQTTRLYLNNGTSDPWNGASGSDVTTDADDSTSVSLGDVDGDGDLDVAVGNAGTENRLYQNNDTVDPFNGVSGRAITADAFDTTSIALGDVDRDGDLDLVVSQGFGDTNRLYLNNGTTDPFTGVSGLDLGSDTDDASSIALVDLNDDGHLDVLVANVTQVNRAYLNNGTSDPFSGVAGAAITADAGDTTVIAGADVDGDAVVEIVAGSLSQPNRLYRRALYDAIRGLATSLETDTEAATIGAATLVPTDTVPPNTATDYWLSNNGGVNWYLVQPGLPYDFPTVGSDLRWRAELRSLSPAISPRVTQLDLSRQAVRIGDRVWEDLDADGIQDAGEPGLPNVLIALYDGTGTLVTTTVSAADGSYVFDGGGLPEGDYFVRFFPPANYALTLTDQGGDDALDSDPNQVTLQTPVFTLGPNVEDETRWDAGMLVSCVPPDEPVFISGVDLTPDANMYTILTFQDGNQPTQVTGYNVYRSDTASTPLTLWTLVASDVVDMDEATPNIQWVDTTGDVSGTGLFFYKVFAFNNRCPAAMITVAKTWALTNDLNSNTLPDVGDTVTYTYTVSNNDALSLFNVAVVDDVEGIIALSDNAGNGTGTLAPGDVEMGTADHVVIQAEWDSGSLTNNVLVTSEDDAGNPVSDTDQVTIVFALPQQPPVAVDDAASTPTGIPVNIDVLANDSDVNGDPLEIATVGDPANGTAVIDDNGTPGDTTDDFITYTSDPLFRGQDNFSYLIQDGQGGSDSATVVVDVTNAVPVAVDDTASTPIDVPLDIDVLANDTDGNNDPLTITNVTDPPNGTTAVNDNGTPGDPTDDTVTYSPDPAFSGLDFFDYTIDDGFGGSDTASVTVNVGNNPPVAVDDAVNTPTDTPVNIFVLANDSDLDGDPLGIGAVTNPPNGAAVIDDNGTPGDTTDDFVTYTPDAGFTGVDTFDYILEDGNLGSDAGTVTVTVDNAPPVAVDDNLSTPTDTPLNADVLANDTDANSDPLEITSVTTPTDGIAVIDDNGTPGDTTDDFVLYTPNTGYRGPDSFDYTIEDGRGGSDTATVNVTVENAAPVAVDDPVSTPNATPVDVFVLVNDSDANGDPLAITGVTSPSEGIVAIDDNGTPGDTTDDFVTYTPNAVFVGIDTFDYTVEDDAGGSDTGTVTVTVENALPVAADDSAVTPGGAFVDIDVLANDTDANNDTLTIQSILQPANGTAAINDNGTPGNPSDDLIRYTPNASFRGNDPFQYTVADGRGGTDQGTVTVTVQNQPPIAIDDEAFTPRNTNVDIFVLANDVDANGDPISLESVTQPVTGASVSINDNGTPGDATDDYVVVNPDGPFEGTTSFTYTINDGAGGQDTATVVVNVDNAAPVANDDAVNVPRNNPGVITVLANDSDADLDPLEIISFTDPPNGAVVVNDNGTPVIPDDDFFDYTPDPGFEGVDIFMYTISDGRGAEDSATVTVTVENTPPDAVDDTAQTPTNATVDIDVTANDSDLNGDPITLTSVGTPSNGTAVIIDPGTPLNPFDDFVRYTPNTAFKGQDVFSYGIVDNQAASGVANVTVTVLNAPPVATDDSALTPSDTPVNIDVLANDTDINGDPLGIASVTDPPNGAAVIDDNGTPGDTTDDFVTYTPDPAFSGVDTFDYTVQDDEETGNTATVTVTVNSAPVAVDDAILIQIDIQTDILVLANDSDPDSDPLAIISVDDPFNGTAVINDNGTPGDTTDDFIRYTPDPGFFGVDAFGYTIDDGFFTDSATITVTVNAPPNAVDNAANATTAVPVNIFVLDNDTDPNGDPLEITVVGDPPNGTAVIDDNGTPGVTTDDFITYTSNALFDGVDVFTYTIEDGQGGSDTATVTVTVTAVEPVAVDDSVTDAARDTPVDIFVLANDSDPNNDPLQIDSVTVPSNGTAVIDDNGTPGDTTDDYVTYTPNAGFGAVDTFDYTLGDGQGNTDIGTVTVTMVNTAPSANADFAVTTVDTSVDIFVLANDFDPDGDSFSIDSVTAAANGSVAINDNGTPSDPSDDYLVYTPDPGYTGNDAWVYRIIDEWGLIDPASVNVTINP